MEKMIVQRMMHMMVKNDDAMMELFDGWMMVKYDGKNV